MAKPSLSHCRVSTQVIRGITDRVAPKVSEWQERALEPVYCIVWLDAMHLKVREEIPAIGKSETAFSLLLNQKRAITIELISCLG